MPQYTYLELDLQIERAGTGYRAQVSSTGGPSGLHEFVLPFEPLEVENFLLRLGRPRQVVRGIGKDAIDAAKTFGGRLFDAVFDGPVRDSLTISVAEARRTDARVRIRLRFTDTPELATLPWEYLYERQLNRFLALSLLTPLVRYLEIPEQVAPLRVAPPLRVLVMISSPSDMPRLDVEREWTKLNDAVRELQAAGLVVLERMDQATLPNLQQKLRQGQYHILHFVGHGGFDPEMQDGVLVLEDEGGAGVHIGGQQLGTILRDHSSLRLAVLNACEGARAGVADPFSGVAQCLVQQGLPAVVAMQFEITDEAAITFTQVFYSTIADNFPVDAAVTEARKLIFGQGNELEWATPVLFMRAPEALLFEVDRAALQSVAVNAVAPPAAAPPPAAAAAPPDDADLAARYSAATVEYWSGHWERAAELLAALAALSPGYRDTAVRLKEAQRQRDLVRLRAAGMAAATARDWPKAVEVFAAIVELDPTDADAAAKLQTARRQRDVAELYVEAQSCAVAKAWPAVIKIFEHIAQIDAVYADPDGLLPAAQAALTALARDQELASGYERGVQQLAAQDWSGAVQSLAAVTQLQPDYRDAAALLERARHELTVQQQAARGALAAQVPASALSPANASQLRLVRALSGHLKQVNALAFTPDGQLLVSGAGGAVLGGDPEVRVWQVADGALQRTLPGHGGAIYGVAVSPDGQLIASVANDTLVRLWQVRDGALRATLTGHTNTVYCAAFSPDGQLVASGGLDKMVKVWQVADGTLRLPIPQPATVNGVAFSPDGQLLATATDNNGVQLWHRSDGSLVRALKGHENTVNTVAFSPDGQLLASGSVDNTIRLWQVSDGALRNTLRGHRGAFGAVGGIAFSPDGQLLVSGGHDKTVRIWQVNNGAQLALLPESTGKVLCVAVSQDGQWIAAAGQDRVVRLWGIEG